MVALAVNWGFTIVPGTGKTAASDAPGTPAVVQLPVALKSVAVLPQV